MFLFALPLILGILLGLALGGRLPTRATSQLDAWLPATWALAFQLAIFDPPLERVDAIISFGPMAYLASMVVIFVVIARNAMNQPGWARAVPLGMAAFGVLLNCAVVGANGGYMPREALDGWPSVERPDEMGRLVNVAPMSPDTRLAWLGDIIPEPRWIPLPNMLSVGDLLLAGGLGAWIFALTLAGAREPGRMSLPIATVPCRENSAST